MSIVTAFKKEFRMISADTWGDAMDAWFEAVGHMYQRGIAIPAKYQYRPGLSQTEPESYWHDGCKAAQDSELEELAEYLFRYCQFLQYKGIDY